MEKDFKIINRFRVIYYYFKKFDNNYFYLLKFFKSSLYLYFSLFKYIYSILIKYDNLNIFIKKEYLYNFIYFLKHNAYFNCRQLLDFTVVDNLELSTWFFNRYEYIYLLLSLTYNIRIFIRGFLKLIDYLMSITRLYNSAFWLEREVWDMFGIFFYKHKNLRRILTDYGFVGHPLRKDFPLSGYIELRYDDIHKVVVMEPLELLQEFRYFLLENPWQEEQNVK